MLSASYRCRLELLRLTSDHFPVRFLTRRIPPPGKPPNLPPSKTKRYRVVHASWMDTDDVRELLWRRHVFHNAVNSLRQLFKNEQKEREIAGQGLEALRKQELDEFELILRKNDQNNELLAVSRKERLKIEANKTKEILMEDLEKSLEENSFLISKSTAEVERLILASEDFIDESNLDEKLAEALEHPVCHDYAIDLTGNKLPNPAPFKYLQGAPTRQESRFYDRTLGDIVKRRPSSRSN